MSEIIYSTVGELPAQWEDFIPDSDDLPRFTITQGTNYYKTRPDEDNWIDITIESPVTEEIAIIEIEKVLKQKIILKQLGIAQSI